MVKLHEIFIKLLKAFILFFGAVLVLTFTLFYVREATKVVNYRTSGTVTSYINPFEDSLLVFVVVDTADYIVPVYPSYGDTIVSIDDSVATLWRWNDYFRSPKEPDHIVPLEFTHAGIVHQTTVKTHLPPFSEFIQLFILEIIRVVLAYSFVILGIWAFIKRADSAGVRALSLFCLGMAVLFTMGVSAISDTYAAFQIPYSGTIFTIIAVFSVFIGAFWLNLQLLFPRPKRFIERHPIWAYSSCYVPVILMIVCNILGFGFPAIVGFSIFALQIFGGFIILVCSYVRAQDSLEKRQTKLVLWGSGIGLSLLVILVLVAGVLFEDWFQSLKWNVLVVILFFVPILLSPISIAYAFGRYRLLEVESKLRRGTRYVFVTVVMLAIFIGVLYLIGEVVLRQVGITSRTPTFIVALALALGFTPAWRRVQSTVESRIYPERAHLRTMIGDFLRQAVSIPDRETLWSRIEGRLKEVLTIEDLYPVIKSDEDSGFSLHRAGNVEPTPFKDGHEIIKRLRNDNRPIFFDEAVASGRIVMTVENYNWLKNRQIAVLFPMNLQSQLIGFVGLGYKSGREDYTADELQVLTVFASQVAMVSENLRLLEENIVKKRMEEELNLAQRIQQRFLPQEIPETPGLEVAAVSRFCLEVAGDYHDVIALPGGETVLAVADVSGKGAGAALLMANLQASLRTSVGVGAGLPDLVARINDLIYQNTPPEQYISFFVARYNPKTSSLTYINAGHNPPILVRQDGQTELLDQGGLILGALPSMEFAQASLDLHSGDLIAMYTDGISEAMNASGEEFGDERILLYLKENHHLPAAEVLSGLEAAAKDFTQNAPYSDDMTLLLARVK